jgi:myo-inositol-1(or 4)-monophosphatase
MDELVFARAICEEAGHLLLVRRHSGELGAIDQKSSITDIVTAVDREVEGLLVERLRERYPGHGILTEESGEAGAAEASHRWVLDPLDGTRNYVFGQPFFCISLALLVEGRRHLGVVHAPYLRETFWARAGGGVFLNGEPVRVSTRASLDAALFATGFACVRSGRERNSLPALRRLIERTNDIRRSGSAAMDLCYVSCGRLDGFWELGLSPWDVAAGTLMVEEAGGRITDLEGGEEFLYGQELVASNGVLHEALRRELLTALGENEVLLDVR